MPITTNPIRHTTPRHRTRRLLGSVAITGYLSVACIGGDGGGGTATEPIPTDEVTTIDGSDLAESSDSTAIVDGEACAALNDLVEAVESFNAMSFEDPTALEAGFVRSEQAMVAVRDSATSESIRFQMNDLLDAWSPWNELFASAGYEFLSIDGEEYEALVESNALLADPAAFTAASNEVFRYGVENCGIPQRRIDAISGASGAPTEPDPETPLVDTGVSLTVSIEGTPTEFSTGFCDVAPSGQLVGSWEQNDATVTILFDTTGGEGDLGTISVSAPGTAGGAQIRVAYDAGRGTFDSPKYEGQFTCG